MDTKRLAEELAKLWERAEATSRAAAKAIDKWRKNEEPWPGEAMEESRTAREQLEQFTFSSLPEIIKALRTK
jgi:hypothetical protein